MEPLKGNRHRDFFFCIFSTLASYAHPETLLAYIILITSAWVIHCWFMFKDFVSLQWEIFQKTTLKLPQLSPRALESLVAAWDRIWGKARPFQHGHHEHSSVRELKCVPQTSWPCSSLLFMEKVNEKDTKVCGVQFVVHIIEFWGGFH